MKPVSSYLVLPAVLAAIGSAAPSSQSLRASRDLAQAAGRVNCKLFTVNADPGPWSDCKDDGSNKWYKTKVLGIKTPAANGGKPCPDVTSPERTVKKLCEAVPCKALPAAADPGPYSDCYPENGVYVKHKILGIAVPAQYGGKCDPNDRKYTQLCNGIDCVAYTKETDPGVFGPCTNDGTGKYLKYKILGIKTKAKYGGAACLPESKRKISEPCNPADCVAVDQAEDKTPFGACKLDEKENKWYQSKVLPVKTAAENGGKCDESARTVRNECKAVDCVAVDQAEDKTPFGACKLDEKENKWYQSKVLPVKTAAENGGKCDESARTVRNECKAVDCVAVDQAEDKTPFGACKLDEKENKWYQSKVLPVKTAAENGGKCDESARTVRNECKAVDCVAVDQAEDKTPFGACKLDEKENKWYQSKVLPVKTAAENGGKCDESARTVRNECKAVDCVAVDQAEDKTPFGACKLDEKENKWYQSKVLPVKTAAENGGKCDESARTVRNECKPIDCVAYTKDTDPGAFGACKDNGSGKYVKEKTLGIKTPAQYGGAECAPEDKRKQIEDCPATDCVLVAAKDDTTAFSECKKDSKTGKWTHWKLLAIKTAAQNGGKCDDKTRMYTEECKAVDCVVTDPATVAWGKCTYADKKFSRSKQLTIVSQPLYGGKACPKNSELTVTEPCPQEDYCVSPDSFYDTCVKQLAQCGDKIKDKLFIGSEIQLIKDVQLYQCCDKCAHTLGCAGYSFKPAKDANPSECSLKSQADKSKMSYNNGAISSKVKK